MPKQKTVADYGSIYEWIKHEWLLPFLVIGGSEEKFWTLTPKSILFYFEVDRKKKEQKEQEMWLMGQYIRLAIETSVQNCIGMTDYKKFKVPEYPKCPHIDEKLANKPSENFIKNERLRLVAYLNSFKKKK
jgi:hypothetical protein